MYMQYIEKKKESLEENILKCQQCGGIKDFYTFVFYTKHVLVM